MTSEDDDGRPWVSIDPLSLNAGPNSKAYNPLESLSRMEARDTAIAAFLSEVERRARVEAACAAAPAGPLHGVVVGVKDVMHVTGLETRAGSALPPEALAGDQATVVDRVEAAGGTVAGKTVTAEFAVTAPGPTRNPRCPCRTPGGSSSGSAAAVAAGMVPLALGTQTVGSVIRPAAYCEVVGFRPTWGIIPLDGVLTNARSLDTVGLFTVDSRSTEIAAAALCQWTPAAPPDRLPVLGVPDEGYLDAADDDARLLFKQQVHRLQRAGYEVRAATLVADLKALHGNLRMFQRFELAQAHQDWFETYRHLYRPATAAAIKEGQEVTPAEYEESSRWRERFIARSDAIMNDKGIDLWITPAATGAHRWVLHPPVVQRCQPHSVSRACPLSPSRPTTTTFAMAFSWRQHDTTIDTSLPSRQDWTQTSNVFKRGFSRWATGQRSAIGDRPICSIWPEGRIRHRASFPSQRPKAFEGIICS